MAEIAVYDRRDVRWIAIGFQANSIQNLAQIRVGYDAADDWVRRDAVRGFELWAGLTWRLVHTWAKCVSGLITQSSRNVRWRSVTSRQPSGISCRTPSMATAVCISTKMRRKQDESFAAMMLPSSLHRSSKPRRETNEPVVGHPGFKKPKTKPCARAAKIYSSTPDCENLPV